MAEELNLVFTGKVVFAHDHFSTCIEVYNVFAFLN